MKKTTITLFALLCGLTSTVFGQSLPIHDQAELQNYALSLVSNGSRSVYSASIDWSWNQSVTYTNIIGATNAESLLDSLVNAQLKYRMANTNDLINGYIYLYDNQNIDQWGNHDLLFFGYASYAAGTKAKYQLGIQDVPLLMITNAQSAEVIALNSDGTSGSTYNINVVNGHPMFSSWMAGSPNGILVINGTDGSLTDYSLWKPDPSTQNGMSETGDTWNLNGHYVLRTSSAGGSIKIIELWNRPTVYLTTTVTNTTSFDVAGVYQDNYGQTQSERPLAIEIDTVGSSLHSMVIFDPTNPTKVTFPPGSYRMRFDWNQFGLPNTLYTGPSGGGKG
jgi:hypothetical protein